MPLFVTKLFRSELSDKYCQMVLCSDTATPATNYDIFDIPLECLPFIQTKLLQASPPILSPAMEAREKNLETLSALFIGSTLSPLPWPAPLPT